MENIWKTLKEFSKYEIDCTGTIREVKTKRLKYCGVSHQGYLTTDFKINKKRYTRKIHRLVAFYFLDPPSKELTLKCSKEHHGKVLVKHLDNNKLNNHYSNLEWSDLEGNTQQAWEDSLISGLKGSKNGRSILTEDIVHKICKHYEQGGMTTEAELLFNISSSQATKIRAGFAWKHISVLYNIKVNKRTKMSRD